ncbi:MAG: hypothetical protein AB8G23_24715 [Myxococcota bacterium]
MKQEKESTLALRGLAAGRRLHESRLFRSMPPGFDLRDEVQFEATLATANELLDRVESPEALSEIECLLSSNPGAWPLGAHIAVKLARSKAALANRAGPLHLSVVVPVYAEHERIQRPQDHPLGEGFVDRKLRELDWLLGDRPDQSFELLIVDDGCPHGSGQLAEEILRQRHANAPARVLHLLDAIKQELPVTAPMRSADESRKGGSIQLGLWEATREQRPGHVLLYTDADLSTHLGQSGLLVGALDDDAIGIAAGSRRARESVVVKSASRSARGRLFIYLWKKLLPELSYLEDTQCGFKAMSAETARQLVDAPSERGFAFDVELLLRCELSSRRSIAKVPIAWIDSQAASTTVGLAPYLPMLRSIVRLYRQHLGERSLSESFARAIEALDEASWERAIEVFGPKLEGIDPAFDQEGLHVSPLELIATAS